ncbi:MAG: hypothetical protein P9M14_10480 [Candidatus Alcyoniella australis]|nr:hypothetical protein [Candidatus Alcyoniella australis]
MRFAAASLLAVLLIVAPSLSAWADDQVAQTDGVQELGLSPVYLGYLDYRTLAPAYAGPRPPIEAFDLNSMGLEASLTPRYTPPEQPIAGPLLLDFDSRGRLIYRDGFDDPFEPEFLRTHAYQRAGGMLVETALYLLIDSITGN